MTTYTDEQLKRALAKMLPHSINYGHNSGCLFWATTKSVLDTELLHLCQLIESGLDEQQELGYDTKLYDLCYDKGIPQYRAIWQQRTIAAAKVKGVEIV